MASLYEWGLTVPWQMTPEALSAMLAIAAREAVDEETLKQVMHGPHSLALRDGKRRDDSGQMRMHGPVAVIPIDGPIYRYADFFTSYSGGITTEALAKDFQRALDDPAVQAILFVVDSPGGEATGINELADTIYAARDKKPSAAYIEGFGASAAYRIAAATGLVVVDADAMVGSIGTVFGVPDPTKIQKRAIEFVSAQSPKKRADPTTAEGQAYYQQLVDDMTETFIAKVMRDRGISREAVLAVGGGMLIGQQAVAAGLADRLGSEDQLIRSLAAEASARLVLPPPARVPGIAHPLRQETPMKFSEMVASIFRGAKDAGIEIEPDAPAEEPAQAAVVAVREPVAQAAGPDPRDARLAELEKQLAEQRQQQIQAKAEQFADGAVRAHQALPAERAQLIAMYVQAAQDDNRDQGQRISTLTQLIEQRPAHSLTAEAVRVGEGGVLETGATANSISPERRQKLLGMTPLGQAVAKQARSA